MNQEKIQYTKLSPRQKEIYNFQKIASVLADYGFNSIKLTDDWQGADFLAYHLNGVDTLRVQLKSRLTIDKKYEGKRLHMAFKAHDRWCLIDHDHLVDIIGNSTTALATKSWRNKGNYHARQPSHKLMAHIERYLL